MATNSWFIDLSEMAGVSTAEDCCAGDTPSAMVLKCPELPDVSTRKGGDCSGTGLDWQAWAAVASGSFRLVRCVVALVSIEARVVCVDVLPMPNIGCSQFSQWIRVCFWGSSGK